MRDIIINEALRLFAEDGVDFKLIDLATNLCISKKTIYKYFKNKEDLLMNVVDFLFLNVHEEQHNIFNNNNLDELTRLKKLVVAMPKDFSSIKVDFLSDLSHEYPLVADRVKYYIESDWEETYALLDICKEKKLIKNIDNSLIRLMIVACCEKLLMINDVEYTFEDLQAMILDVIIAGIKNI